MIGTGGFRFGFSVLRFLRYSRFLTLLLRFAEHNQLGHQIIKNQNEQADQQFAVKTVGKQQIAFQPELFQQTEHRAVKPEFFKQRHAADLDHAGNRP